MKKLNLILILFIGSALFMGGCDFVNEEINIDPNKPTDVSMELLLPPTQTAYAFVAGGDFGRFATIWSQQHAGVERQHAGYEVYLVKEGDVNGGWTTMYADVLNELSIILTKADETSSPHYAGVAKVMTAASLGMLVDLFGDIPYTQALQGATNLTPTYDNANDVYTTIQTLLDESITDLANGASNFSPGNDDLIYGGDLALWTAAARTLKARYHLHLSAVDGAAHASALADIDAGAITSNASSAMIPFEGGNPGPWFLFEVDRGDVVMSGTLIDMMNNISDPRLAVYATQNDVGVYAGAAPGMPDNSPGISRFGSLYASAASSIAFVSYAEAKFIEAEAAFETGDMARSATAHNEAITASLDAAGVSDTAFLAAEASETMGTITLEKILTHKYIALYSQLEVYNDLRRTGIPALSPSANSNASNIATRFPYPGDERRFNINMPQGVTVFDKIFWDAN